METIKTIHRNIIVAALLILLVMLITCSRSGTNTISETGKSRVVVAKKFEEWKTGKSDFFELLADDVVWEVSGRSPVSGVYKGKKDFLSRAVQPVTSKLLSRIVPELISLTADEKYVWLHWRGKAVNLEGGSYENIYAWKLELRDQKIISAVAFLDTYSLNGLMKLNPMK